MVFAVWFSTVFPLSSVSVPCFLCLLAFPPYFHFFCGFAIAYSLPDPRCLCVFPLSDRRRMSKVVFSHPQKPALPASAASAAVPSFTSLGRALLNTNADSEETPRSCRDRPPTPFSQQRQQRGSKVFFSQGSSSAAATDANEEVVRVVGAGGGEETSSGAAESVGNEAGHHEPHHRSPSNTSGSSSPSSASPRPSVLMHHHRRSSSSSSSSVISSSTPLVSPPTPSAPPSAISPTHSSPSFSSPRSALSPSHHSSASTSSPSHHVHMEGDSSVTSPCHDRPPTPFTAKQRHSKVVVLAPDPAAAAVAPAPDDLPDPFQVCLSFTHALTFPHLPHVLNKVQVRGRFSVCVR